MTPLALELEGFTVYRQHTLVEWRGAETGLFAVTGPTGAGKSTLLDAITYVLYGKTARLGSKGLSGLISPGAEALFARLTFRTARGVYRATRVAQRKSAGVGTEVRIEEVHEEQEGGWRQLPESERVKDANQALERIVGLDYDGFTRAVLLPQGAFDEFLRGDAGLRRQLLASLLGLDKVESVQRLASSKAGGLRAEVEARRTLLDTEYAGLAVESLEALEREVAELEERVAGDDLTASQLGADLATLRDTAKLLAEHAQLAVKRERLEADSERVDAARAAVEQAKRAAKVAPHAERLKHVTGRVKEAASAAERREQEVADAQKALTDLRAYGQDLRREVAENSERLSAVAAALQEVLPLHEALVRRGGSLSLGARSSRSTVPEDVSAPSLLDEAQWSAWQAAALLIAPFERALQAHRAAGSAALRARAELEAQERAVAAGAEALAAKVAEGRRLREADEAARERLDRVRRQDLVAAVREGLAPGDPCPVCGGEVGDHEPSSHQADLKAAAEHAGATATALAAAREEYESARLAHSRVEANLANVRDRLAGAERDVVGAAGQLALTVGDLEAHGVTPRSEQVPTQSARAADSARSPARAYLDDAGALLRAELDAKMAAALTSHALAILTQLEQAGVSFEERSELVHGESLQVKAEAAKRDLLAEQQRLQELDTAELELGRKAESAAAMLKAAQENRSLFGADLEQAQQGLERALTAAGFAGLADLEEAHLPEAEISRLEAQVQVHEQGLKRLDHRMVEVAAELAASPPLPDKLSVQQGSSSAEEQAQQAARLVRETELELRQRSAALAEARQLLGGLLSQLESARQKLKRSVELRRELTKLEGEHALYHQLNTDLHGHRFPEYLLTQVQQLLARRASAILQMVTDGRYDLRLEAGDYLVADAWAGGELRSARTLSGGESFVASLALALALSDTLAGSAALGALFLDEGFGTLDRATLESVTAVLESLTSEGRMVGVITHVPELSARLPARLVVSKGPGGSTVVWDT